MMNAISKGRRPTIPSEFPALLKPLIERGWSSDRTTRPAMCEFHKVLMVMVNGSAAKCLRSAQETARGTTQATAQTAKEVSMSEQSCEVAKVNRPMPVISLEWNGSCEVLNSRDQRAKMIQEIRTKSNFKSIINGAVIKAMSVTPRHLFVYDARLPNFCDKKQPTQQDSVTAAYLYYRPIPGTAISNEASPEIVGTQLSLTEITPGQDVLLVGITGGYIQSLVAQLVGTHGSVVTVTSNATALDLCRDRVNAYCPLKHKVRWIKIDNITNVQNIVQRVCEEKLLFHTIIYSGAVDRFPEELEAILHKSGNAAIMAPVNNAKENCRFQLWLRRSEEREMRTITDFSLRFQDVL